MQRMGQSAIWPKFFLTILRLGDSFIKWAYPSDEIHFILHILWRILKSSESTFTFRQNVQIGQKVSLTKQPCINSQDLGFVGNWVKLSVLMHYFTKKLLQIS